MTKVIESSPAPSVVTVTPRRAPLLSRSAATERAWLQDGFDPPVPDLQDFLAEAAAPALCNAHRLAVVLFVLLIGLASVLKVDVVVTGSGRLSADAPTIVLQPLQLSVIRKINVKPGNLVHRGDVLAALDPTFTQADKAALLAQQSALGALTARLNAELTNIAFELPSGHGDMPEWQLQQSVFQQRGAQFSDRLLDFAQKVDGLDKQVIGIELSRTSLQKQVDLAKEVETMRSNLFRAQLGSKLTYLEAQAARVRAEHDLQAAAVTASALQREKRSTLSERQSFVDGWRHDLLESLVKAAADTASVNEALTKANRFNDLVELTAPQDGVVLEVAKRSVGSVLNAAEPLITMVPSDAALIADISLSSADIGYVKVGDPTVIKVDAFPYQRHGFLQGRLRSIAEDSNASSNGAVSSSAYHHGQVEVVTMNLVEMPEGARLIPGMTLTAEVKVGTRSVLSYLTYPLTRGIKESIREP
jgi:HlyD family secretion protein